MRIHIRKQNLSRYLFGFFLFFLPLETRKVFLTDHSFYTGSFTEYGSLYLYLSDLFLLLTALAILLFHRSELTCGLDKPKDKGGKSPFSHPLALGILLSAWFFLSALSEPALRDITIFRSFKMLEMVLMLVVIWFLGQNTRNVPSYLFALVLSGIFQSLIAIYQYFTQHSLFFSPFWHKMTGETILGPDLPGVAKIVVNGEKMARAYGTFPHPNLLAGFLILTLFISVYLYIHHYAYFLSSLSRLTKRFTIYPHFIRLFWTFLFVCQLVAIFLSFSRSAWLALGFGGMVAGLLVIARRTNVSRETFSFSALRLNFVSRETISNHTKRPELIIAISLTLAFAASNHNLIISRSFQDIDLSAAYQSDSVPKNDAFADRKFFQIVSRETICLHPLFGSGPNTAIYQITPYLHSRSTHEPLAPWQYQPTHNVYLLIASEIGLIGLFLFLLLLIKTLVLAYRRIVSRETILDTKNLNICLMGALTAFLLIGCLDHYFWTLQQGQLMFWTLIGLMIL